MRLTAASASAATATTTTRITPWRIVAGFAARRVITVARFARAIAIVIALARFGRTFGKTVVIAFTTTARGAFDGTIIVARAATVIAGSTFRSAIFTRATIAFARATVAVGRSTAFGAAIAVHRGAFARTIAAAIRRTTAFGAAFARFTGAVITATVAARSGFEAGFATVRRRGWPTSFRSTVATAVAAFATAITRRAWRTFARFPFARTEFRFAYGRGFFLSLDFLSGVFGVGVSFSAGFGSLGGRGGPAGKFAIAFFHGGAA